MKAKDLKNSILQMAVQGKLVPQDPSDEPASALLERIREERRKLIAEGKMKASKGGESVIYRASDGKYYEKRVDAKGRESEPVCIQGEIPFEIPDSWEWARLGEIVNIVSARRVHKSDWRSEGVPFYRAREIVKLAAGEKINNELYISNELFKKLRETGLPQPGDLMVTGVGTIGTSYIVKDTDIFYYKDASVLCFENRNGVLPEFLQMLLMSDYLSNVIRNSSSGTTVATITMKNAIEYLIPLPPVGEQRRAFQRFKEITPLFEDYDALETEREQLDAELPERLRKSILQMAVQGKLVAQDPNDEPASALLERIRGERRKLIADGKMKAPKGGESVIYRGSDGGYYEKRIDAKGNESEPVCIDDEIPFEIPDSWEWCRLGSLCDYGRCTNIELTEVAPGTWNLELEDIERDTGKLLNKKRVCEGDKGSTKHVYAEGDVLYSKLRPYLNKVIVADENGICSSEIVPLHFLGLTNLYAQLVLMSPMFVEYATMCSYGVKMPRLGTENACAFLIPVPPATEQTRILTIVKQSASLSTNQ